MNTFVLFSLLFALATSLDARPVADQVPVLRRWYDSNGCALDSVPPGEVSAALSTTPLSTLSNLGPYSPYIGQISPICRDVPDGMTVDQVQIYARHGARNPTANALKRIQASLAKVVNRTSTDSTLGFLETYSYGEGVKADQLTDFGRRELWAMGDKFRQEYADLHDDRFIRAASDGRVVESGEFFLQGLRGEEYSLTANKTAVDLIISEADGQNNTLSISTCTTDEALDPPYGDVAEQNWLDVFAPPIAKRINSALLPAANITGSDVTNLISLCSFDSLQGAEWAGSPWCRVFSDEEFKGNEYYYDLSKFYDHAWGSPYARASGTGLVNEIIARLTGSSVLLGSGTNSTLDTDPTTFPTNRSFYADFSHDNNLATLLPALGLDWETDLPSQPDVDDIPAHKFIVSSLVPFAGRFVFERLVDSSGKKFVRLIVNDAVKRLDYAGCGDLGLSQGLCELEAFVEAQSFARQEPSAWEQICYAPPINKTVALQA